MLVKNQGIFDTPQILWKLYDMLSVHPSCKDLKIISLRTQVYMRHQKIYVRAEMPTIVGTKFLKALLRLEFLDLPKDKENGSTNAVYRADIATKDGRIRGSRSQEAQDTLASSSSLEMSFSVTDLLRPTLQLGRRHFTAHLKIHPAKRLMKGSLKVFLLIQDKDTTCSDFSLPDLQGGSPLLPLNASDPSERPAQCRRKSHVVQARDIPVSFSVLRPVEIDVGDCEGRCDLVPGRSLFSNHAALKAYYEKAGGGRSPCCAPTGFRPVLMMGQEPFSNFVSILEVPNIRISSCACM